MQRVNAVRKFSHSVATQQGDGKNADVTFDGITEHYANTDNPAQTLMLIKAFSCLHCLCPNLGNHYNSLKSIREFYRNKTGIPCLRHF